MQTIVFTLRFDRDSERAVRAIRERVNAAGIKLPGVTVHRPHITVAAYDVEDVDANISALTGAIRTVPPFELGLDYLGVFPERRVAFLAPRPIPELRSLHQRIVDHFSGPDFPPMKWELLLPGRWVPHCTIAADLSPTDLTKVIDICHRSWTPVSGRVEAVGVLLPPAVEDSCEVRLRGDEV
ncbi:MAG TPA: 2'-5' RNA ligase family protein [Thermomicrobiales bacterium]|nr:2'-5' RNA ligase family protein [Thermomicrobiales bacterium]